MSDLTPSLDALRVMTSTQAAAHWIAREDRDVDDFARWLADSEDNRVAWHKAERVWALFDDAGDDAMISAMARAARQSGIDTETLDAETDVVIVASSVPTPANDDAWRQWLAAAVAVLVVMGGVVFGLQNRDFWTGGGARIASVEPDDPLERFGSPDFVTNHRQGSIVDLADGTRVTLDPDSALDVAYGDSRRDARLLRGHGYFDVAHDAARPFAVEASGRVVTALGTRFDVALEQGKIRVILLQGSVSIASAATGPDAGRVVRLRPGQTFTAVRDQPGTIRATNQGRNAVEEEGFAAFDNQPLSVIVARLNRTTRAQIFIRDPKIDALRVTGQFRTGDVVRFGRALEMVLPIRLIDRGNDRYELLSKRS
ncbi:FecR family protein [Sphingomonas faeni]|uniref:FecR family protein n=1 Tax=Sphingomonas faeni TaxID=185950 RepID=UPI00335DF589